jgi:Protein-L-isoaspartate(D-aspartate) O-methyltransferase (PCMT)
MTDIIRALRARLADELTSPADPWHRAVAEVPRHVFVPSYLEQGADGQWQTITGQDPRYAEAVYADRALTTQVTGGASTSSSSEPSLMLAMLHALDVRDGNRVLEIGTGTGYNAALLAHRLGDELVTTVDKSGEQQAVGLWMPDGSTLRVHADGTVRQTGPRDLWRVVEELHALFPDDSAEPAREDFGITVTPERQYVWYQKPDGAGWDLPLA